MDLFLVGCADIFAIYPKLLREILQAEEAKRSQDGTLPTDFIFLPSDAEFQEKVYYHLLTLQKAINDMLDSGVPLEEIEATKDKHIWDPEGLFYSISTATSPASGYSIKRRKCVTDDPMTFLDLSVLNDWNLEDLVKAGKLLRSPPIPCEFSDEYEMRRIYSMIYDVFRYKHVMSQALHDVSFFVHYPDMLIHKSRIWLLLFDLHLRHFAKRKAQERIKQQYLYEEADLTAVYKLIWSHRIYLAAAISRLRIKNGALRLANLLPIHLQDDKVAIAAANPIVTGWINPFKMKSKNEAKECMRSHGFLESIEHDTGESELMQNHFKWDKLCPLFLSCIPEDRGLFAQTDLIRQNRFVMQDRAFSFGPAIFSRLLHYYEVEGDVAQTHVSSPRSVAYLAALFYNNNRVRKFIAFGAGTRLREYQQFLERLACDNVKMYAENFCDIPMDSPILENVVGIFVTPPNSYSGVTDPIDLICSRGGDLTMLEVLTESEMSDDGKERVAQILHQQRESLRMSMSRPQVQFCLYETHSIVESENEIMVSRAVECVNRCAHSKHIRYYKERKRHEMLAEMGGISADALEKLQGGNTAAKKKQKEKEEAAAAFAAAKKLALEEESSSGSSNESENEALETTRSRMSKRSNGTTPTTTDEYSQIRIPKTDLYETTDIPDFCIYQDRCVKFSEHGCFLSLVKRKLVTRLDEKYLIVMAERRGLFGDTSTEKGHQRPPTKSSKKEDKVKQPIRMKRRKSDDISILITRISMPTHVSIRRSQLLRKSSAEKRMILFDSSGCSRHMGYGAYKVDIRVAARAKRWWNETTKLVKLLQLHVATDDATSKRDSELLYRAMRTAKLPPLQLQRTADGVDMVRSKRIKAISERRPTYPLSRNSVEFQEYRSSKLWNVDAKLINGRV